jgi:hypothetical protein
MHFSIKYHDHSKLNGCFSWRHEQTLQQWCRVLSRRGTVFYRKERVTNVHAADVWSWTRWCPWCWLVWQLIKWNIFTASQRPDGPLQQLKTIAVLALQTDTGAVGFRSAQGLVGSIDVLATSFDLGFVARAWEHLHYSSWGVYGLTNRPVASSVIRALCVSGLEDIWAAVSDHQTNRKYNVRHCYG